ncbi:hypothetical protein L6V77_22680 [Myxococcota bacterium]|nr:hypothetical protein [Myxococcota bacterium]
MERTGGGRRIGLSMAIGLVALGGALLACSDITATNPYDPATPESQQAPGALRGEVRLLRFAAPDTILSAVLELLPPDGGRAVGLRHPDADGHFAFESVPAGQYLLRAALPGFVPETRSVTVVRGETSDLGVIALQHDAQGPDAVAFAGRVRLRGETDHGGTTVRLQLAGRDLSYATLVTDATGRFETPASKIERYRLNIEREGWRLPAGERTYAYRADPALPGGGRFEDEASDGTPPDLELLPSEAPVCTDGEVDACVERLGACLGGRRICANGQWGACDALTDELCDGIDNDCDGQTDEALTGDRACRLPNAAATCRDGACVVAQCLGANVDVDGKPSNGCECAPSGQEAGQCDYLDNDCDGAVDEDIFTDVDPENCGACGRTCAFPQATSICVEGECAVTGCEDGFHDFDGDPLNGCEAACTISEGGAELCDYRDNDCDGVVDEDHLPLDENVRHCGTCGNDCRRFANGSFGCSSGHCVVLNCEPGFRDLDGEVSTGCEYACLPTNGGVEACDAADNDCDGLVDEDFDLGTDLDHCGACGAACATPNATPVCRDGRCRIERCDPGWVDADSSAVDGCEAPCEGSTELCNGVDDDCDGDIDEPYPEVGEPCTSGIGACRAPGRFICSPDGAGVRCGATPLPPADETCNGVDDDCNGTVDEGFDLDRDGFTRCGGDCDDTSPDVRPGATESCNGRNDDCDARTDEGYDLDADPFHCGRCGVICAGDAAEMACVGGRCVVETCARGFWNIDGLPETGCEYACVPSDIPVERCDGRDDDCNGVIDEDFELGGPCDGRGACGQGRYECRPGGDRGCSTAPGGSDDRSRPETCDGRDEDCDGAVDEDFDLQASLEHCGRCQRACALDGALAACVGGACTIAGCRRGFHDIDGLPANGCEYACTPSPSQEEVCDARDNDCDGLVDEDWPVGDLCVVEGECGQGALECDGTGRGVRCDTAPGSSADRSVPEQCNGRDDDCDGAIDEEIPEALVAADPSNCGGCGHVCPQRPGAVSVCDDAVCGFACAPGFLDADRIDANGCELACNANPEIMRLTDGTTETIRAALAGLGPCGRLELTGTFALDDPAPLRLTTPGLAVSGGPDGATFLVAVSSDRPAIEIAASGVRLSDLRFETPADTARSLIEISDATSVTLERLEVEGGSVGCGGAFETGQHALIRLDGVTDSRLDGLTILNLGYLGGDGPIPDGCQGTTLAAIDLLASRRVTVSDAFVSLRETPRTPGIGHFVSLRFSADSALIGNTFQYRAPYGVDAGGRTTPFRVVSLAGSDRNRIERNLFVGGDGSAEGAVGVYLAGRDNRIQFNEFGPEGHGGACLALALDVQNTANLAVTNTYYGGEFILSGQPEAVDLNGFSTTVPRDPMNLGTVVVANARAPVVRGVAIQYSGGGHPCEEPRAEFGAPADPDDYSAGIHVIDSTEVVVEGNTVSENPDRQRSPQCGRAAILLRRVQGGRIVDNTAFEPAPANDPAPGCTQGDARLQATIASVEGAGFRLSDNVVTQRDNRGNLLPGRIAVVAGTEVEVGPHTLTSFVSTGDRVFVESLVVHSQAEIASFRGLVRGLRMIGEGAGALNLVADVSGERMVLEDTVIGRPDCPDDAAYSFRIQGDHAEVRGFAGHCLRSSPTLGFPGDPQSWSMTVRNALFDLRGARTPIYLRGYGTFVFDQVTIAHAGLQADPLFFLETIQPVVVQNAILSHFPRLFDYYGPAPCCGRRPELRLSHTALWQITDPQPASALQGAGVVVVDPAYRNAAAFDYTLAPGSPAIDAADPALPVGDEPAPNGGRRNLGAEGGTERATPSPR